MQFLHAHCNKVGKIKKSEFVAYHGINSLLNMTETPAKRRSQVKMWRM